MMNYKEREKKEKEKEKETVEKKKKRERTKRDWGNRRFWLSDGLSAV